MAIRAFLSEWTFVPNPGGSGGEITHPILEHVDAQPYQGLTLSMFFPDADANGLPDKPVILVLVRSRPYDGKPEVAGPVLEQLRHLKGVSLLPAFRGDKPVSELPPSAKNDFEGLLRAHGVPNSVMTNATTVRDMVDGIAQHISPNHSGFVTYWDRLGMDFA